MEKVIIYKGVKENGEVFESFNVNDIPEVFNEITVYEIDCPKRENAEREISILRMETEQEIDILVRKHLQSLDFDGTPIPEEIKELRILKKLEYRQKKEAIYEKYGITNNP